MNSSDHWTVSSSEWYAFFVRRTLNTASSARGAAVAVDMLHGQNMLSCLEVSLPDGALVPQLLSTCVVRLRDLVPLTLQTKNAGRKVRVGEDWVQGGAG